MTNTLTDKPQLLVADLDGTLLHDAEVFENRNITQHSIDVINRAHDAGYKFAVATARPVSTGLRFAQILPVDAVIYLNGALIDFDPAHSNFETLTKDSTEGNPDLIKIGFSSKRACEVCQQLLKHIPGLKLGIVMNDVRYTNFDVRQYWKTQSFQYTNFQVSTDASGNEYSVRILEPDANHPIPVPQGTADKITIFPEGNQWDGLESLIPDDFDVSISEGVMWMLMNPNANKQHAMNIVCERLGVPLEQTVAFGDDLIDIDMMRASGRGVAVSNANPKVLAIADEVCPANNDDGVAQWIESQLQ
ncbi:HAD family hydrolase [Bifidobacterium imperatoris]|uniref:HAD family hydrolase n=1 Tax=Bifidobacterium imperatoris TaxID=2020965 RepID=A0A2N5IRW2_9BIFI|nr:HAD family hydrolase [Bifidobacterium imperatoris]PLS24693.1 Haloacid dehalogenase domain-containing protein hydrolase, type 3 [Bifidobacterium imperatoris]QSY57481.1 HAD family hydrolase [Bifidobacterium imperatoris]